MVCMRLFSLPHARSGNEVTNSHILGHVLALTLYALPQASLTVSCAVLYCRWLVGYS